MANAYGVDVSSFQPTNMASYANAGAKLAIVKLSEGMDYRNPKATSQIASAKANGMMIAGYFFATFSSNATAANYQAQVAVATARQVKLAKGSYLAVDWETGDGNVVTNSIGNNTQALLSAMASIKLAGYKPLLYAGAYDLKVHVDRASILWTFPNSLWVASYPYQNGVRVDKAPMGSFPSMDGVAIWQFTDNWCGMSVDGNIAVLDLKTGESEADIEMAWHPEVKIGELGRFMVNRQNGASLYGDAALTKVIGTKKYGESFKIFRAKGGAVCAGDSQWFSQADGLTKINPLAVNSWARGICKITVSDAYTQNLPKAGQLGITHLPKGGTYKVFGRSGKYLLVGSEKVGKYVDGDKCVIVL
jgi:GH25 family lysozyme M1 (1,4-beta-N-acetylmuramidase)